MKRAAVALVCVSLLAGPAAARSDGFAPFWKEFSEAAAKKDKAKIASLTQYPFEYKFKPLGPKDFDTIWREFFPSSMLACLGKAKPKKEYQATSYSAFCKQTIYVFDRTPEGWRFITTGAND